MNPIHKKSPPFLATAISLALCVGSAISAPVTVANFSFESPDITGANITGVPTGWTAPNGATGIKYRDDYTGLATSIPNGNQWALVSFTSGNTGVTLAQDTGVTIVEGVTYSLTVAVGEQDNQATVDNIARIFLYGATTGDTSPFALLDNIEPIPDANITAGDDSIWIDYQVSFTATAAQAGQSLVIGLGAGSNIGNGAAFNANVSFDNVRLYAGTSPLSGGSPVIYEPFDYTPTGAIGNDGVCLGDGTQSGARGLAGAWSHTSVNIEMEVTSGGLTFTDLGTFALPVSGNSILRSNRIGTSVMSSAVDPAATTALTADNTTMWMSFLYVDSGFSGPDSSVILASEPLASASPNHALSSAGYGVGILIGEQAQDTGARVEAGYYLNSTTTTRAQSTVNPNDSEGTVFLLAAKINWKPDGTPDELFVFNITDLTTEPSEEDAIASITFDMPLIAQQSLDTLNIGETQVDGFDEIRFGTSFADLVSPTSPVNPAITSFTSVGGGVWEVELHGKAGGQYVFHSDPNLVFNPGTLVENLTQGANGAVGGTSNSVLTLDGSGLGVVQMTLSGNPRDFIRAQTAP